MNFELLILDNDPIFEGSDLWQKINPAIIQFMEQGNAKPVISETPRSKYPDAPVWGAAYTGGWPVPTLLFTNGNDQVLLRLSGSAITTANVLAYMVFLANVSEENGRLEYQGAPVQKTPSGELKTPFGISPFGLWSLNGLAWPLIIAAFFLILNTYDNGKKR